MNNGGYTVSVRLEAWRSGVFFQTLRAEEIEIKMSQDAQIKTSLRCRIDYDPALELLGDRLRPYQIIDGVEYPMGEFIISTTTETVEKGGRGWQVEAYDPALLLRQATTATALRFAAGTAYLDAVRSLLAECGIARVIDQPSALIIETDREDWEIGTPYLSVANELLSAINYAPLWFDRGGAARLQKEKAAVAENLTQSYLPGECSILADGITRETDAYTAYNVFTAVYSAPDAAPMVAVSVNDSPLSPISTVRRGRRICAPAEFVDEIASQQELQAYADRLKAASLLAVETVEFETAPIPTHWVGEIVAIAGNLYRETGWTLRLGAGGSYTHTAKREVAV